jgi:membrane associated rhomboid family serine protease
MFPLRDSIPPVRRPIVNLVVIGVCTAVFLYEFMLGPGVEAFVNAFGFVPARFFNSAAFGVGATWGWLTLLTSMFMHGGWLHLIGNMWFLWVFGDNVEDSLGHGRYIFFYVVCGAAAALAQAVIAPSSTVPMVGASGAIAGVLGARTKLETQRFEMLLKTREVLTAEQWGKLREFARERRMERNVGREQRMEKGKAGPPGGEDPGHGPGGWDE